MKPDLYVAAADHEFTWVQLRIQSRACPPYRKCDRVTMNGNYGLLNPETAMQLNFFLKRVRTERDTHREKRKELHEVSFIYPSFCSYSSQSLNTALIQLISTVRFPIRILSYFYYKNCMLWRI